MYLQDLIGAYICFFVIGAFELVLFIKILSGTHSVQTRNILLLLVVSLVFAVASAQLKFQIDTKTNTTTFLAVLSSICIFFYSTSSSLAFWIYSCHIQKATDVFFSVRHAGAKGCFTRLRFAELVVAVSVIILEILISASKYLVLVWPNNSSDVVGQ